MLSAAARFQVSGCNTFKIPIVFNFSHVKAYVSKIDLAVTLVKVIPGSSFDQTMMGWSPEYYKPSFTEIGSGEEDF